MYVGFLNLLVVVPVIAVLLGLRLFKPNNLIWAIAFTVGSFCVLKFGLLVPIPASVVNIYMMIVVLGLFSYAVSSAERKASTVEPVIKMVTDPKMRPLLAIVLLGIPTLVAANVYFKMSVPLEAPQFGRTIHPASPEAITVGENQINLLTAVNPYDELHVSNPEAFAEHVAEGRRVYYENCHYCHGDEMSAVGVFGHGLNPIPTNFLDPNVIPNFQSSFFFWRVSKGAPGLPAEGGPWDSAMPAWEKFLSEEEIWDVLLFLSDFTGYTPRANEGGHE